MTELMNNLDVITFLFSGHWKFWNTQFFCCCCFAQVLLLSDVVQILFLTSTSLDATPEKVTQLKGFVDLLYEREKEI